jgi:hypothetical protein
MSGYYSIIQYMPVPRRREAVNIGVILLEKDTSYLNWVITRPIRRIQQVFPGTSEEYIQDLVKELHNRMCASDLKDLDDMTGFVITQQGTIQCTEPQWLSLNPGTYARMMHKLLEDLVL